MVLVKATGVPEAGKNFGMRECYRYITSHDDEGKAVFVNEPPLLWQEIGQVAGSRSYGIASIPARLHDDNDLEAYLDKDETNPTSQLHLSSPVVPAGVGITVVNFKPGASTGMHRTVSLDCSVCLEGHISMEMDSGQIKELFPGDHVIQRGTSHRWINLSDDKPARLIGFVMASEPIIVKGNPLPSNL